MYQYWSSSRDTCIVYKAAPCPCSIPRVPRCTRMDPTHRCCSKAKLIQTTCLDFSWLVEGRIFPEVWTLLPRCHQASSSHMWSNDCPCCTLVDPFSSCTRLLDRRCCKRHRESFNSIPRHQQAISHLAHPYGAASNRAYSVSSLCPSLASLK